MFGVVVGFTPVVFVLAPENIAYNAVPRAVVLALVGLSLGVLARRRSGEGGELILLAITAMTAMTLFEASLTQVSNHPSGLSPLLFFLGVMMIAPLQPKICLLLGAIVICAPWLFWWSGRIDADPVFRIMYAGSSVAIGGVGAVSSWQRRAMLLARFRAEQALIERGEHLREATEELELLGSTLTVSNEQLQQQAEELEKARDAAQASDTAKSLFLSRVSHETRTPLGGILGFAELLEGRHFGELNERQAGYVRYIRESGEHLLELINDLLDVTRLDTGAVELSLEDVSPAEVVLEVVHNVELGSHEQEISIVNEVGSDAPTLRVDRRRFRQSLYNLLSNALKFTPAGGGVGLRWRIEPGDKLCIEVWDRGIGIAAEDLASVFDEFHQVDRKRDEALGGSGLGLALTRRLAELHGGQLRAESELGRGSSFFLVMPLAISQPDLGAGRVSQEGHSGKPAGHALGPETRVLVVDDTPANVEVIRGLLEVRGIDPIVARSGQEAVALVSRARPQLVFMDIHMPGCDGFDALAQIRAHKNLDAISIVAMTAGAGESDRARYLEAGFDDFLAKPIDSVELDDQLKRFVSPSAQS